MPPIPPFVPPQSPSQPDLPQRPRAQVGPQGRDSPGLRASKEL
jgi:hypothetical protein